VDTRKLVPLTTGDVFCWLEDNGHFIRDKKPVVEQIDTPTPASSEKIFCPVCGLKYAVHPIKETSGDAIQCDIVPPAVRHYKMPIVNVGRIFAAHPYTASVAWSASGMIQEPRPGFVTLYHKWSHEDLVSAADPSLTVGVIDVVKQLQLPSFTVEKPNRPGPSFPLDEAGESRDSVTANIASYAALSLAVRQFIRALINGGLEISKRDRDTAINLPVGETSSGQRQTKRTAKSMKPRMLTPMHIISGVIIRERGKMLFGVPSDVGVAIYACLARLGVPTGNAVAAAGRMQPSTLMQAAIALLNAQSSGSAVLNQALPMPPSSNIS
jgi:hypothetical protein